MTPEEETWQAATKRLHELQHAVDEAQAAADKAPRDTDVKGKLDMAVAVREAGRRDLAAATAALARSRTDDA